MKKRKKKKKKSRKKIRRIKRKVKSVKKKKIKKKVTRRKKRKKITSEWPENDAEISKVEISGTLVRDLIINNNNIPDYLLHNTVVKELKDIMKSNQNDIFFSNNIKK